jgi:hypothetical protein
MQDAPYGIRGVANNLNPMWESFQRLTVSAGGFKGAFTAMLATLSSPAGIGIAIAAISSLAVVFSGMGSKTKEATVAVKEFSEYLEDAEKNVREMTRAQQVKAFWNNEQEIFNLKERYRELTIETNRLVMSRSLLALFFTGAKGEQKNAINEQINALTEYNKKIEEMIITQDKQDRKKKEKEDAKTPNFNADMFMLPDVNTMKEGRAMLKKHNEAKAEEEWKIFWGNEHRKNKAAEDALKIRDKAAERAWQKEQRRLNDYKNLSQDVFQAVGAALGNSLIGQDANARDVVKNIAGMFITMAE